MTFSVSGYTRRENDNYQTVDTRCIEALLSAVQLTAPILDPCCSDDDESALVTQLVDRGYAAFAGSMSEIRNGYSTIITNPPYKRGLVDRLVRAMVDAVRDGNVDTLAILVRASWDQAATRRDLFDSELFAGAVRLTFRPWWTSERSATPIHNYQWLLWTREADPEMDGLPFLTHVYASQLSR